MSAAVEDFDELNEQDEDVFEEEVALLLVDKLECAQQGQASGEQGGELTGHGRDLVGRHLGAEAEALGRGGGRSNGLGGAGVARKGGHHQALGHELLASIVGGVCVDLSGGLLAAAIDGGILELGHGGVGVRIRCT